MKGKHWLLVNDLLFLTSNTKHNLALTCDPPFSNTLYYFVPSLLIIFLSKLRKKCYKFQFTSCYMDCLSSVFKSWFCCIADCFYCFTTEILTIKRKRSFIAKTGTRDALTKSAVLRGKYNDLNIWSFNGVLGNVSTPRFWCVRQSCRKWTVVIGAVPPKRTVYLSTLVLLTRPLLCSTDSRYSV